MEIEFHKNYYVGIWNYGYSAKAGMTRILLILFKDFINPISTNKKGGVINPALIKS